MPLSGRFPGLALCFEPAYRCRSLSASAAVWRSGIVPLTHDWGVNTVVAPTGVTKAIGSHGPSSSGFCHAPGAENPLRCGPRSALIRRRTPLLGRRIYPNFLVVATTFLGGSNGFRTDEQIGRRRATNGGWKDVDTAGQQGMHAAAATEAG